MWVYSFYAVGVLGGAGAPSHLEEYDILHEDPHGRGVTHLAILILRGFVQTRGIFFILLGMPSSVGTL